MIEIVLTVVGACKVAGFINGIALQIRCHEMEIRLNFMAESVTPQQCMQYGQHEIAKWAEGHPKWRIARWSCGPAKQTAKA